MDAALKAKWVEALRSGKYEQGRQSLKNARGEYCCLGVLLEVQGAEIDKLYPSADDLCTTTIPLEFSAGLSAEDRNDLANKNDGSSDYYPNRQSFSEIADYIEKHL